jgi:hypothetical protein
MRLLVFILAFISNVSLETNAQVADYKNIATLYGKCRLQIVGGFSSCNSSVTYMQLKDGHIVLFFEKGDILFKLTSTKNSHSNSEDYYLDIDTFEMRSGNQDWSESQQMEGECHFQFKKDAPEISEIKCDLHNASKSLRYAFYLEDIKSFKRN